MQRGRAVAGTGITTRASDRSADPNHGFPREAISASRTQRPGSRARDGIARAQGTRRSPSGRTGYGRRRRRTHPGRIRRDDRIRHLRTVRLARGRTRPCPQQLGSTRVAPGSSAPASRSADRPPNRRQGRCPWQAHLPPERPATHRSHQPGCHRPRAGLAEWPQCRLPVSRPARTPCRREPAGMQLTARTACAPY